MKLSRYDEVARLKIVESLKVKEVFDEVEKRIDGQFDSLIAKTATSATVAT